jgi:hypothetical protein
MYFLVGFKCIFFIFSFAFHSLELDYYKLNREK